MKLAILRDKKVLSWAIYDWANSAYATTVMAGFFPIFFKSYWAANLEATESTFRLGLGSSASGIVIVILAPILGAIADAGGIRKRLLLVFTLIGVSMSAGLPFVEYGEATLAIIMFVLATIGFLGSMVFYDSLIVMVAEEKDFDLVSAFGYALGYLGGGLMFAGMVVMTLSPETFGLKDDVEAVKIAFWCVSVWWLVFALPVMINVPEKRVLTQASYYQVVVNAFKQLHGTFLHIRNLRYVAMFLVAYWLYIDGVDTVVFMAVDYGVALGFSTENLITALLITQFVGFPAALAFGILGNRIGAKTAVLFAICVYTGLTFWAFWIDSIVEFYAMAITIGLVQGGVQSLSRSMFARMIPADKSAEFFGFYNMVGKFAAIIGPTLVGTVALLTGNPRFGILSISVLFITGGILLYFVNIEAGKQAAKSI